MEKSLTLPSISQLPQVTASDTACINKWSWGGFFISFFWALGSRLCGRAVLYFFLFLIPGVNLIMMIYLGVKGRRIAWLSGKWSSVDEFRKRQKLLDVVGATVFIAGNVISLVVYFLKGQ